MIDDYQWHHWPGWKQLLCTWFIFVTVATLLSIMDLVSPNRSAPLVNRTTDLVATADTGQTDDLEPWERGVPRQSTKQLPDPRRNPSISRVAQVTGCTNHLSVVPAKCGSKHLPLAHHPKSHELFWMSPNSFRKHARFSWRAIDEPPLAIAPGGDIAALASDGPSAAGVDPQLAVSRVEYDQHRLQLRLVGEELGCEA
jgi:hypothetical protein